MTWIRKRRDCGSRPGGSCERRWKDGSSSNLGGSRTPILLDRSHPRFVGASGGCCLSSYRTPTHHGGYQNRNPVDAGLSSVSGARYRRLGASRALSTGGRSVTCTDRGVSHRPSRHTSSPQAQDHPPTRSPRHLLNWTHATESAPSVSSSAQTSRSEMCTQSGWSPKESVSWLAGNRAGRISSTGSGFLHFGAPWSILSAGREE